MIALLLALSAPAHAAPATFHQSGRLLDAAGAALNGAHSVSFSLFAASTGGAPLWTSSPYNLSLQDGYYSVALGDGLLTDAVLDRPEVWLEVSVDTQALTGRSQLLSVPYARSSAAAGALPSSAAAPQTCDAAAAGTLYWNTTDQQVYACNSAAWTPLGVSGATPGQAPATAEVSCAAVHAAQPAATTGPYWIDPAGTGAVQAWCDMDLFQGGWELVMNLDTSDGNVRNYRDDAWWTATTDFGTATTPYVSDFKSGLLFNTPHAELLIAAHQGGTILGWRAYDMVSPDASLRQLFSLPASRVPLSLTSTTTGSSVSALDAQDVVVRPGGHLQVNVEWGSTTSYDLARVRNSTLPTTDNVNWGLGIQMDAQNNGQFPFYPGCDAGGSGAWSNYFCIGTDRSCAAGSCGNTTGGSLPMAYDYAIFLRTPTAPVAPNASLLGNSSATAASTCDQLHTQRPAAPSGTYWVNPSAGTPFQTSCDMTTNGGGWTLVMNLDTSDGNSRYYRDDAFWTGSADVGTATGALTSDFKSGGAFTAAWSNLMIRAHRENVETLGWRSWSLPANTVLATRLAVPTARTGNQLTTATTGADIVGVDPRDVVVRPAGNLHTNVTWGNGTSYDLARLRSGALPTSDNVNWGLGIQMDAQNNGQFPLYPGCDAGSSAAWSTYFCIGQDRTCTNCGDTTGTTRDLETDYAIYVK